jgi:hypothetical protein
MAPCSSVKLHALSYLHLQGRSLSHAWGSRQYFSATVRYPPAFGTVYDIFPPSTSLHTNTSSNFFCPCINTLVSSRKLYILADCFSTCCFHSPPPPRHFRHNYYCLSSHPRFFPPSACVYCSYSACYFSTLKMETTFSPQNFGKFPSKYRGSYPIRKKFLRLAYVTGLRFRLAYVQFCCCITMFITAWEQKILYRLFHSNTQFFFKKNKCNIH